MNKPIKSGHRNSVYSFNMSKNRILTSIKSCNSATNLRKMTLYNPNLDLINIYRLLNVYRKIFGTSSYGEDARACTVNVITIISSALGGYSCSREAPPIGAKR